MADLEIIEGDLEKLSTSIYAVYADVTDAHGVFAAVGNAESSMPGSSSASSKISSAVTTLDDQRRDLKRRYKDFSTDVKTAADAHWASEEQAKTSLESAGLLDGGAGGDGPSRASAGVRGPAGWRASPDGCRAPGGRIPRLKSPPGMIRA